MGENRRADAPACGPPRAVARSRKPGATAGERTAAALLRTQTSARDDDKTIPGRALRPQTSGAADLDDAAGRALSAGISRVAGKSRQLSRSVFHAGICGRGHTSADPPFQL